MGGGRVCVQDGQAVHEGWTLVHVAATKLQLHPGAVRVAATNVYELQTFRFT